jgi:hypothetical protein
VRNWNHARRGFIAAIVLSGFVGLWNSVEARAAVAITQLNVYPADINLSTLRDRQPVLVIATRADGVTLDVTAQSKFTLANPALARLEGATLFPVADGETTLQVTHAEFKQELPVKVSDATAERQISFKLDIMPIFMRSGCNTGSCHGAARGKDGFRLSLFGFDPDGDHYRLTKELGTRRINLAIPSESLLMEKSVGAVPHSGGKRFEVNSDYYNAMYRWLAAGAPLDAADVATVTDVEIYPPAAVLEGAGTVQQFIARAKYSDGTDRDITDLAVFLTSNDNSAPVDPRGQVTAAARGEAFVMARFSTFTVGSQVLVLPKDLHYTEPTTPPTNYVDELVNAKLKKIRIEPSEICSDETFLRRVTLDITGLLPTVEEHRAFLADTATDKRAKKIDDLLSRKEFSEIWAMKWSELLMVKTTNQVEYKPMF